jgi:hypothetical protein
LVLARKEQVMAKNSPFDWIDFPDGRVKCVGGAGAAGRDDPPVTSGFAVEFQGHIYHGEIRESYLPDRNNFNLEVVSFGWPEHVWSGQPAVPGKYANFSVDQLASIQSLVCLAVQVWAGLEDRPSFLDEFPPKSRFMGGDISRWMGVGSSW